jgi:NAD kinase
LDYKLSKDGRYLLRAYRKNDYDDVVEGYVIETGLGFLITIDYDHFKEIFQSKKKKEKLEKKDLDATGPQGPQAPGDDKKD